jgi:hypothetical protein
VDPAETSRDWRVRDGEGHETVRSCADDATFCDDAVGLLTRRTVHGRLARDSEHDLTPPLEPAWDARRRIEVLAAAFAQKHGERFTSGLSNMAAALWMRRNRRLAPCSCSAT